MLFRPRTWVRHRTAARQGNEGIDQVDVRQFIERLLRQREALLGQLPEPKKQFVKANEALPAVGIDCDPEMDMGNVDDGNDEKK